MPYLKKRRSDTQSTAGDIFMKRKLGVRRPHILHQFYARKYKVQRAPHVIFLCDIQGKLIKTNFFLARNNFRVRVSHFCYSYNTHIETYWPDDIIKNVRERRDKSFRCFTRGPKCNFVS